MLVLKKQLCLILVVFLLVLFSAERSPTAEIARGSISVNNGLVSMKLKDVRIKDVLKELAEQHGLNMIIDEDIEGSVSISLTDMDLEEALDAILGIKGYAYRQLDNGIVLVERQNSAEKEERGIIVREFNLNYLEASDRLLDKVGKLLSSKGEAIRLPGANAIVVKDLELVIKRVEALLLSLDTKPRQILIEARIVEASSSLRRELGVNWTSNYRYESNDVMGGLGSMTGDFGVNLPSMGTDENAGLGLGFGIISDKLMLDIRLSALEESGAANILSSPKIIVLDNHEAVITTGTEILVPQSSSTTYLTTEDAETIKKAEDADEIVLTGVRERRPETFTAKLELTVTPRVVNPETVALSIDTKREEFIYDIQFEGYPPKDSRTARTELLMGNGQTVVLGGINTSSELSREKGVPILSKIPLLGWLFKRKAKGSEQKELLIFLTPTIQEEKN
jgi:type IV pilus assembly protein PilQ